MEIWKDIKNYEGLYQVSNLGNIKSFWHKKEVIMKQMNNNGYSQLNLYYCGLAKKFYVHRLVAKAFIPNPENKPQVNHIDGNKQNNNINNLEWVTNIENEKHAIKLGLKYQKGESHPSNKLTENEARVIKFLYSTGKYTTLEIAEIYNISHPTVSMIGRGKTWSHI